MKTFPTFSFLFRAPFYPLSQASCTDYYLKRSSYDQINVDKDRFPFNKYRLEKRIYVNLCPSHYAKAIALYRFERETINSYIVFTDISRAVG